MPNRPGDDTAPLLSDIPDARRWCIIDETCVSDCCTSSMHVDDSCTRIRSRQRAAAVARQPTKAVHQAAIGRARGGMHDDEARHACGRLLCAAQETKAGATCGEGSCEAATRGCGSACRTCPQGTSPSAQRCLHAKRCNWHAQKPERPILCRRGWQRCWQQRAMTTHLEHGFGQSSEVHNEPNDTM